MFPATYDLSSETSESPLKRYKTEECEPGPCARTAVINNLFSKLVPLATEDWAAYCQSLAGYLGSLSPELRKDVQVGFQRVIENVSSRSGDCGEAGCPTEGILPTELEIHAVPSLAVLPEDVCRRIITNLDIVDLLQLRQVDKRFNRLVESFLCRDAVILDEFVFIRQATIRHWPMDFSAVLRRILRCHGRKITILSVLFRNLEFPEGNAKVGKIPVSEIVKLCPDLVELKLVNNSIAGVDVDLGGFCVIYSDFVKLRKLKKLDCCLLLTDNAVGCIDTVLGCLRRMEYVKSLEVSSSVIDALLCREPRAIVPCVVEQVVVDKSSSINSTKFSDIFRCSTLCIDKVDSFTRFVDFLPQNLSKLAFWNFKRDFTISELDRLKRLQNVVEFAYINCSHRRFPNFEFLSSFEQLEILHISAMEFDDDDFKNVAQNAPLKKVDVSLCKLDTNEIVCELTRRKYPIATLKTCRGGGCSLQTLLDFLAVCSETIAHVFVPTQIDDDSLISGDDDERFNDNFDFGRIFSLDLPKLSLLLISDDMDIDDCRQFRRFISKRLSAFQDLSRACSPLTLIFWKYPDEPDEIDYNSPLFYTVRAAGVSIIKMAPPNLC